MSPELPAVFNSPLAYVLLGIAIVGVVLLQRRLGWEEYRVLHRAKVALAPRVSDRIFIISEKGRPEVDDEFVSNEPTSPKMIFQLLKEDGFSPHLVSSVKRRPASKPRPVGGAQYEYTIAHLVKFHPEEERQTEVYLFAGEDGGTDIYSHNEVWVMDAEDHYEEAEQVDGDPADVVPDSP